MILRFVTCLVKPWDDLNHLLREPFAYQPEMSDVLRLAGDLAVAIEHQPEQSGVDRNVVAAESFENRLMVDVGDAWKHGTLRNPARQNELTIKAHFECSPTNEFRFLRNAVHITHSSLGQFDFMETAGAAIEYWIRKLKLPCRWTPVISEGPVQFQPQAILYYNPQYQVKLSQTRLQFLYRENGGGLIPYDPPTVTFVIYDVKDRPA